MEKSQTVQEKHENSLTTGKHFPRDQNFFTTSGIFNTGQRRKIQGTKKKVTLSGFTINGLH